MAAGLASLSLLAGLSLWEPSKSTRAALLAPTPQALELPPLTDQLAALDSFGDDVTLEARLGPRERLGDLLARLDIQDPGFSRFLAQQARLQASLPVDGADVRLQTDRKGRLVRLQLFHEARPLAVVREGEGLYKASLRPDTSQQAETLEEMRSVEVSTDFFAAMDEARVPDEITEAVVSLFESDLDFRRQVRPGDVVRVVYSTRWLSGRQVGRAQLLAARFEAGGKTYEAFAFEPRKGRTEYYNVRGESVRRGMLAAPLRYTRITSSFAKTRLHPLFGDARAHKGTDYAAPVGTPVRSVADGRITHIGWQGGYGLSIAVEHNRSTSTYYAHLSSVTAGLKKGQEIKMGDIIGKVGTTGWATGPHLHYEFRLNGRAVDPSRMAGSNPAIPPLTGQSLAAFQGRVRVLSQRLELLDHLTTAAAPQWPPTAVVR